MGSKLCSGGAILDSTWLFFGVHLESAEQMDAWHRSPLHQAAQRSTYERWRTATYLRKWREAAPGEVLQGRVMCEARLLREAELDAAEIQSLREALAGIAEAGAQPFEMPAGDFEPQPYQFAGPVGIAPKVDCRARSSNRL
ncbi:hypothetical protein [Trinickia mobilis]|uniref:hypothetical protein n=1 Tax=Trinickia mobilis TaxID=2816356 RepID=UPI001A902360|nr:hypothetical protein [Trinickia mobilis]